MMLADNSTRSAKLDATSNIIYYQADQINVQSYIFQGFARNANKNLVKKKFATHSQRKILGKPLSAIQWIFRNRNHEQLKYKTIARYFKIHGLCQVCL
jgi:hypothetical protein